MIWWGTLEVLVASSTRVVQHNLEWKQGGHAGIKRTCVCVFLAPPCVIVGRHPCVLSGGCGVAFKLWVRSTQPLLFPLHRGVISDDRVLFSGLFFLFKGIQRENDKARAWLDATHLLNLNLTSWITSCSSKIMIQNIYTTLTVKHCVQSVNTNPIFFSFQKYSSCRWH